MAKSLMTARRITKLIQDGEYVAEVDVTLIETDSQWSPYFGPNDVRKLDAVRQALRNRDFQAAAKLSRVYKLEPVAP